MRTLPKFAAVLVTVLTLLPVFAFKRASLVATATAVVVAGRTTEIEVTMR